MTSRTVSLTVRTIAVLTATASLLILLGVPAVSAYGNAGRNQTTVRDIRNVIQGLKGERKELKQKDAQCRRDRIQEIRERTQRLHRIIKAKKEYTHHVPTSPAAPAPSASPAASSPSTPIPAATPTATPTPSIDIAVTKTDDKLAVKAGETNTYVITVTNLGPAAASPAYVMDTLPSAYESSTVTASCPLCSYVSGAGTFSIYAEAFLNAGQSVTLTVTAKIKSTASGTIINTAYAGSKLDAYETDKNDNGYDDATFIEAVSP